MEPIDNIHPMSGCQTVYVPLPENAVLGLLSNRDETVKDLYEKKWTGDATVLLINKIGELKLGVIGTGIKPVETTHPFYRIHFNNGTHVDLYSETKLLVNKLKIFRASYNGKLLKYTKNEPHIVGFIRTKTSELQKDDSISSIYIESRNADGKKKAKSINYLTFIDMNRTHLYNELYKKIANSASEPKINKISSTIDRPAFPIHQLPLRIILGSEIFAQCYRSANKNKKFKFKPQIHHLNNDPKNNELINLSIFDQNAHIKLHKRFDNKFDLTDYINNAYFQEPARFIVMSNFFTDKGCAIITRFRQIMIALYNHNQGLLNKNQKNRKNSGGMSWDELSELSDSDKHKAKAVVKRTETTKRHRPGKNMKVRFTMELAGIPVTEKNWNATVTKIKKLIKDQYIGEGTKREINKVKSELSGFKLYKDLKKDDPTYLRERYDHLLKSYKEMRNAYQSSGDSLDSFPKDDFRYSISAERHILRPASKTPINHKFLHLSAFLLDYNKQITLDQFIKLYKLIREKDNKEPISYHFPLLRDGLLSIGVKDKLLEAIHSSCKDAVLKQQLMDFIIETLKTNDIFKYDHKLSLYFFGDSITLLKILYDLSEIENEDNGSLNHRIDKVEELYNAEYILYKIPILVPLEENNEYPILGVAIKEGKGNMVMVAVKEGKGNKVMVAVKNPS